MGRVFRKRRPKMKKIACLLIVVILLVGVAITAASNTQPLDLNPDYITIFLHW
jgi:hypothetical protein